MTRRNRSYICDSAAATFTVTSSSRLRTTRRSSTPNPGVDSSSPTFATNSATNAWRSLLPPDQSIRYRPGAYRLRTIRASAMCSFSPSPVLLIAQDRFDAAVAWAEYSIIMTVPHYKPGNCSFWILRGPNRYKADHSTELRLIELTDFSRTLVAVRRAGALPR